MPACIAAGLLVALATIGLNRPGGGGTPASVANPTLEPARLARTAVERSVPHWIAIERRDGVVTVNFAPILADSAALRALRYGIDDPSPNRDMVLPAKRDAWPLDGSRVRDHSVTVPPGTRFVSVGVEFKDGTRSPVALFAVPAGD